MPVESSSASGALFRRNRGWLVAALAIAAVVLLGNWPLIAGSEAPIWDATYYYAPLFSLVVDHARSWHLLLWNPWMSGGSPDFADPQSGASSPVIILFGFLFSDPLRGFIWYWLSIWIFGGWGMLLLCRHLKCPVWGGTIVALGFVASGYFTGHAEHTSLLYSFAFLPWIVWRFDLSLERRSYWNAVQAAALWGLSGLGGYPGMVVLNFMLVVFWGLGRALTMPRGPEPSRRKPLLFLVAALLLMGAVGTAILSPAYVAFLKFARGYTFRTDALSKQRVIGEVLLPPQALGTFASPYLHQLSLTTGYHIWPETDVAVCSVYLGVVVVMLALLGLWRRDRWRWWLGLTALFFFCCSVGKHLPLRGWVYDLVPPTRYFRFPSLFSAYGMFALCVLAALATGDLDGVEGAKTVLRRRAFLVATAMLGLAIFFYVWILHTAHLGVGDVARVSLLFAFLWFSALAVFFSWWRGWIARRGLVVALLLIALADAFSALRVSRPVMYTAGEASAWSFASARHVRNLDLTRWGWMRTLYTRAEVGGDWNDLNLVLKEPMLSSDTGMVNRFHEASLGDALLRRIALGDQRTWFSAQPVWSPVSQQAFASYRTLSHQLGTPPLVLHQPSEMMAKQASDSAAEAPGPEWAAAAPLQPAQADLLLYFPNRLEFRYHADSDGWLLVTDRWAPGWTATVNGRPATVYGANFVFRGIAVERGDNTVSFRYQPPLYVPMLIASWTLLALIGCWQLAGRRLVSRLRRR